MRSSWNRATPLLDLKAEQVEELLRPAFGRQLVETFEAAHGGLANSNFRVQIAGRTSPVLIRIFVRDSAQMSKEYKLNALIRDRVAVPDIFYGADTNPFTNHAYMIMEWIDGDRLEVVAPTMAGPTLSRLAQDVGKTLAAIHSFTFPHCGFFNNDLELGEPLTMGGDGLLQFAQKRLLQDVGGERLGVALTHDLLSFIEREGKLLDSWDGAPCLTHSDFGGSNILVRQNSAGEWNVAAVLDWEFAFAGTPFFDFGNLLRDPLGALAGFESNVALGYTAAGATLPFDWRKISRLIDLTAWLDFLTRANTGPQLIDDARAIIQTTITSWSKS